MIKNLRPPSTQSFMARTIAFKEATTNEKLVPVSNNSLLKNPFNNQTEPMPEHGLRPLRKVADTYGHYIVKTELKAVPVSNKTLLQAKRYDPKNGSFLLRHNEPMPVPSGISKEYRKLLNLNVLPPGYALNKGPKKIEIAFLEKLNNDNAKRVVLEFMKNSVAGSILKPLRLINSEDKKGIERNAQAKEAYDSSLQELLDLYQRGVTSGPNVDTVMNGFLAKLKGIYNTNTFDLDDYVDTKDVEKSIKQLQEYSYQQSQVSGQDREDPNGIAPKSTTDALLQQILVALQTGTKPNVDLANQVVNQQDGVVGSKVDNADVLVDKDAEINVDAYLEELKQPPQPQEEEKDLDKVFRSLYVDDINTFTEKAKKYVDDFIISDDDVQNLDDKNIEEMKKIEESDIPQLEKQLFLKKLKELSLIINAKKEENASKNERLILENYEAKKEDRKRIAKANKDLDDEERKRALDEYNIKVKEAEESDKLKRKAEKKGGQYIPTDKEYEKLQEIRESGIYKGLVKNIAESFVKLSVKGLDKDKNKNLTQQRNFVNDLYKNYPNVFKYLVYDDTLQQAVYAKGLDQKWNRYGFNIPKLINEKIIAEEHSKPFVVPPEVQAYLPPSPPQPPPPKQNISFAESVFDKLEKRYAPQDDKDFPFDTEEITASINKFVKNNNLNIEQLTEIIDFMKRKRFVYSDTHDDYRQNILAALVKNRYNLIKENKVIKESEVSEVGPEPVSEKDDLDKTYQDEMTKKIYIEGNAKIKKEFIDIPVGKAVSKYSFPFIGAQNDELIAIKNMPPSNEKLKEISDLYNKIKAKWIDDNTIRYKNKNTKPPAIGATDKIFKLIESNNPKVQIANYYVAIRRYRLFNELENIRDGKNIQYASGRKSRKSKKEPLPKLAVTDEEYKKSTKKLLKREKSKRAFQEILDEPKLKRGATRFSTDELNQIIQSILSAQI
jgi:hypothetical protein